MADIVISLAELSLQTGTLRVSDCGEAITAGSPIFEENSQVFLSHASDTNKQKCTGIAMMGGKTGDKIAVARSTSGLNSQVTLAASGIVKGTSYVVSTNLGMIAPRADLVAGDKVIEIGTGRDDGKSIDFLIHETSVIL